MLKQEFELKLSIDIMNDFNEDLQAQEEDEADELSAALEQEETAEDRPKIG